VAVNAVLQYPNTYLPYHPTTITEDVGYQYLGIRQYRRRMGAVMSKLDSVSFTVPGKPITKSRPRIGDDGHGGKVIYNTKETTAAEELIQAYYRQAAPGAQVDEEGFWQVDCVFYTKDKTKCDLDNLAKLVLDALTKLVWKDDCRVWTLNLSRDIDRDNPRTEVTIERQPDM
jgi:Holliday junction resolvase RusA-like endonuclease